MKSILALAAAMMCVGCASQTEMGVRAFNVGHYQKAYTRWVQAAAAGDAVANYNMALLWQHGLTPQTPKNIDQAGEFYTRAANLGFVQAMAPATDYQLSKNNPDPVLNWLTLGARWNDSGSIERLRQLGAPIPTPDLAIAQQQVALAEQQNQALAALSVAQMLGCAMGGCAAPVAGPTRAPAASAPPPPAPVTCRAQPMRDLAGNLVYRCK